MASRLVQIITLLYQMQTDDIRELEAELLKARKREWRQALRELGATYGCNASPNNPSGRDLAELKAMSAEDAKSIAKTYNRDIAKEIERLYRKNPRGNRVYYYSNLQKYITRRNAWKLPQIALTTAQQTRWWAQSRFRAENGLRGRRYTFTGPIPVCKRCVRLFAAGVVTEAFIQRHATPIHPLCPHEWTPFTRERIPCSELWLG